MPRDSETLTTCSPQALKHGYYNGLKIAALDGRQFIVKSARKLATKKQWWIKPIFLTLISVDLEIEENGCVSLDELKRILLKAFKANRYIWEASMSYEEFAREIGKCRSFKEIADYLGNPGGPEDQIEEAARESKEGKPPNE